MEIRKTIQYTPEILQMGYSLHLKKNFPFRSKIILILGTFFVLFGLWLSIMQSLTGDYNWLSWGFMIYGLLLLAYYKWQYSSMGKSAYKKLQNFHYPFEFTFKEDEVITVGRSTSSTSSWDHYQKAVVTDKMILLYPNKLNFIILPRQFFTDEEFAQLSEWVIEKVKCK